MSGTVRCHHPETAVEFEPTRYAEDDVVVLTVRMSCKTCGARFQFRGMSDNDPSPMAPWVSCDGFIAALPMVEVAPRAIS
jgi:hypothetical protein